MAYTENITFLSNLSSRELFLLIGQALFVITEKMVAKIDTAAHKCPWAFIIGTVAISVIVSFVCIAQARADRDRYNAELYKATAQLDKYKIIYNKN